MNADDLLQQGIAAFQAGRKAEARELLLQLVEQDERNEMAWLWLSGAVETEADRLVCLENVLEINPHNRVARRGVEALRRSPEVAAAADAAPYQDQAELRPGVAETDELEPTGEDWIQETHALLGQAVEAIKAGATEEGRELLIEVLERDENNQSAWLWMTRCVTDPEVKRECFERVLSINPDNQYAVRGLKRLGAAPKAGAIEPTPQQEADEKRPSLIKSIARQLRRRS